MGQDRLSSPSQSFRDRVLLIVSLIPRGKVATYGQVALLAGVAGAAQAVGNILHVAGYTHDLPFQRVINQKGGLARGYSPSGILSHKRALEADGVEVSKDFTVNLKKYLWHPSEAILNQLQLPVDLRIELAARYKLH